VDASERSIATGHVFDWVLIKRLHSKEHIRPPGPFRRWLSFRYCELSQREIEYVALSRDTTESDLKQRREVYNKTAVYMNQSAVTAAIEGRILIIEGSWRCM
jgi:hypothetical protein